MASTSSPKSGSGTGPPNIIRPALDVVDRAIIDELSADARLPNNALAERVGIAAVHLPGPGPGAAPEPG